MKRTPERRPAGREPEPSSHAGPAADEARGDDVTALGAFIDNSPRMQVQRRQLDVMTGGTVQRLQRYSTPVLEGVPFAPYFTSAKVGRYTVPKRMLARPLALPKGPFTGKRETENTPLWKKLKGEQESIALKDGHLLNHRFGGPADATNMVPISADANVQMAPFDAYVESLMTRGGVVDLEVAANYGRSDGATDAQNAVPTSLDMRVIPQQLVSNAWVDDPQEPVVVQNVVINLDSDSKQAQKAKRKSQEYSKRDQMWAKLGALASAEPQATEEGPELPNGDRAGKNERDRQGRYQSFTSLPQWSHWKQEQARKKRDKGARDIVSGSLADRAWTGAAEESSESESEEIGEVDEMDEAVDIPFDEADLQEHRLAMLVSTTTHWLIKAEMVQNDPGLIDQLRHYGWNEAADLMTQYLEINLSKMEM